MPSPSSVEKMIIRQKANTTTYQKWIADKTDGLTRASAKLKEIVDELERMK